VVLLTVSFSIFTYLICQIFLWKNKHILEILSGFRFFGFLGGGKI
jgi:hypothetical protein